MIYIHGTIQISQQLLDQALEDGRVWRDIQTGRRRWDDSEVDWDAIERDEWEYEHR